MTIQLIKSNTVWGMWFAVALALITAIAYILIALGILDVGDLQVAQDGGAIVYVAAGCYLLGGLLVLLRKRWLWIVGLVINSLVILFFFYIYQFEALGPIVSHDPCHQLPDLGGTGPLHPVTIDSKAKMQRLRHRRRRYPGHNPVHLLTVIDTARHGAHMIQ